MAIFSVQGLYDRQKVRENYISLKLDKRLGVLCQVIEFLDPCAIGQWKVYLEVALNCFYFYVFVWTKNFGLKIIWAILLLIHGQNNHPAWSVKIAVQSVKSERFFFLSWDVSTLWVH